MKTVTSLILTGMLMGGCITTRDMVGGGVEQRFLMTQVGVVVRVRNNCTALLDLETVNGPVYRGLVYGNAITIPLVSTPFSGTSRYMLLTAVGYTAEREYLGSITRRFSVDTYEGSRQDVWEVDQLRLPKGRGGCQ